MTVKKGEKLAAIREAAMYKPLLGAFTVGASLFTALLEGVGVGFILPIVNFTQSSSPSASADGILGLFVKAYAFIDVPFSLESSIVGVAAIMTLRFAVGFLVGWSRVVLTTGYKRSLRERLFEALMYAPVGYVDEAGSDKLLNSLITEANKAGSVISALTGVVESSLRALIYLTIATVLSPALTVVAILGLGASVLFVRFVLEPAYAVGDEVAEANNRVQNIAQTGIQGMRDVRLFNSRTELIGQMQDALERFFSANVKLGRNQTALNNLNRLINALVVFALVYVGVRFTNLSLGEMGVFLFAIFRLSPTVTQIHELLYGLNGVLPHLVRVQSRLRTLDVTANPSTTGSASIQSVTHLAFENVSFSYDTGEQALQRVSFGVERGEHLALVGQSGEGKSTIVSLLGRLRTPDSGDIRADSTTIDEFDTEQWRDQLGVVRQNPYLFNETLRKNITVGNRDASHEEVERVCEIARVTEFVGDLPNGYETELGENGVRLSGGQKQRVAIARALLKNADVLVFDEATSELDSNIERQVYAGIDEMEGERAMISIAHRLSTVSDADRIYTLVDGSVAEVGTHENLLASDGMYADLYSTQ